MSSNLERYQYKKKKKKKKTTTKTMDLRPNFDKLYNERKSYRLCPLLQVHAKSTVNQKTLSILGVGYLCCGVQSMGSLAHWADIFLY